MEVTPSQFDLMRQMMGASHLRHQVVSHNLANINTPGYHRKDVDFEGRLGELLRAGDSSVNELTPRVFEVEGLPERADGNNVDVDREIGQLNKNALLYQTWSQILASRVSMMRSAIDGR
jgi:flagellar basal-body rod protein FlgB